MTARTNIVGLILEKIDQAIEKYRSNKLSLASLTYILNDAVERLRNQQEVSDELSQ